ncbi:shikimate kinase [Sedimentibacter sp.]|uniref:shikimate kinase n=1 Tax=Sedimentibacter sp. TaxID=1960295 RepID=UPI0028B21124|nr:shikimate kinase [Sedimentibacter sp.]
MSRNIVLIGMPGSGKTVIGKETAKKLNMIFVDMDEMIQAKESKSIAEIFKDGEEYFRSLETDCAKELGNKNSLIISTGGGIVKRKENIDYLKRNSIVVFINRHPDNIVKDVDIQKRPLLSNGIDNIYKLYNERIDLYKKYCDIEVINDKEINDSVEDIIQKLKRRSFVNAQDDK